jgi:5-methylcytosine-specific restriction protein B
MKFYGLWISKKDENAINRCLDTGIWYRGECPNIEAEKKKISSINIGSSVFLYKGLDDVLLSKTPFLEYLDSEVYDLESKIVKAQSINIGKVIDKNLDDLTISVEWDKSYKINEWYIYFRQDGVWTFENETDKKGQALYDIVFNNKQQQYEWWVNNGSLDRKKINLNNKIVKKLHPFNQILYGPPGTGKTYNTINKAIEIIENRIVNENEDRKTLKDKYEEYEENGQIEFVTFHQSYGYEEFVEGIKAKTGNNGIEYSVEKGIFKICVKRQRLILKIVKNL